MALEILTGVCAILPDPKVQLPEKEDEEHSGDEDEGKTHIIQLTGNPLAQLHVDIAMEMRMQEDPPANSPSVSFLPTLVAPLVALIQPTTLSFPPLASPSPHPPTTSVLSAIHICALECLNNIFLSLTTGRTPNISTDLDAGRRVWDGIWSALGAIGTETGLGQERRREMWHVAVGVLWGIGNVWKGSLVS